MRTQLRNFVLWSGCLICWSWADWLFPCWAYEFWIVLSRDYSTQVPNSARIYFSFSRSLQPLPKNMKKSQWHSNISNENFYRKCWHIIHTWLTQTTAHSCWSASDCSAKAIFRMLSAREIASISSRKTPATESITINPTERCTINRFNRLQMQFKRFS